LQGSGGKKNTYNFIFPVISLRMDTQELWVLRRRPNLAFAI
jgi:hypothetical protein